ncbi:DUF6510 family protein [Kibdelosporangium philippinense]|uniref:DUF6510 family protein n=2 Tax=Kibdelosporangium philippinense TaxID=211113 RepID=A0ABS8Z7Z8_9PSEU|nr:DUF6510 family protein [Kibdelosporangium philippinense]MCE7003950.1 DUF6510 family protein [Kibdelosporangium philippinense]
MHVDGNAVAAALGFDVSVLKLTCGSCARVGPFAEHLVYDSGPGIVVRCAGCGEITARMVRTDTEIWLDLRGSQSVRVPLPAEA